MFQIITLTDRFNDQPLSNKFRSVQIQNIPSDLELIGIATFEFQNFTCQTDVFRTTKLDKN